MQRKNIPRKGIARPQSQFPHSCERFIYSNDLSAYSAAGKYRSWEYIKHPQTNECGNWDCGSAIPRKGIHKWDFRCSLDQWIKCMLQLIM
jgi:hypothetical protein